MFASCLLFRFPWCGKYKSRNGLEPCASFHTDPSLETEDSFEVKHHVIHLGEGRRKPSYGPTSPCTVDRWTHTSSSKSPTHPTHNSLTNIQIDCDDRGTPPKIPPPLGSATSLWKSWETLDVPDSDNGGEHSELRSNGLDSKPHAPPVVYETIGEESIPQNSQLLPQNLRPPTPEYGDSCSDTSSFSGRCLPTIAEAVPAQPAQHSNLETSLDIPNPSKSSSEPEIPAPSPTFRPSTIAAPRSILLQRAVTEPVLVIPSRSPISDPPIGALRRNASGTIKQVRFETTAPLRNSYCSPSADSPLPESTSPSRISELEENPELKHEEYHFRYARRRDINVPPHPPPQTDTLPTLSRNSSSSGMASPPRPPSYILTAPDASTVSYLDLLLTSPTAREGLSEDDRRQVWEMRESVRKGVVAVGNRPSNSPENTITA
ncbi:hypothetical protein DFS34DRAFT_297871 [Phlyctochytrium arcticum]|nr:hypothetical protein DFS34DRAFT_297871 [Phlyctochytrium arcticum]